MPVSINANFDCSRKELVYDIASVISIGMGYKLSGSSSTIAWLANAGNPRALLYVGIAEEIFELLTGDRPDYAEDEEDREEEDDG